MRFWGLGWIRGSGRIFTSEIAEQVSAMPALHGELKFAPREVFPVVLCAPCGASFSFAIGKLASCRRQDRLRSQN